MYVVALYCWRMTNKATQANKYPVESWNQELCRKVVVSALGTDVPFDIHSYRPWLLSRKVAKSYRQGNVFLCVVLDKPYYTANKMAGLATLRIHFHRPAAWA
jgi:hypothetical protein